MDRRYRGERESEALVGMHGVEVQAEIRAISPELHDTLVEDAFGGPLSHPELSRADREIATIAVLAAAGGAEPQLAVHAAAARGEERCYAFLLHTIKSLKSTDKARLAYAPIVLADAPATSVSPSGVRE